MIRVVAVIDTSTCDAEDLRCVFLVSFDIPVKLVNFVENF